MALALAVPSRLWLGGVLSVHRGLTLILTLVRMVRAAARGLAILVCVDGLASYVTVFTRVFRHALHTCRRGRPRSRVEPGLLLGQVVKRYTRRHVVGVVQRVVRGTAAAIAVVMQATGTGTGINTAYIERLIATFRSRLATRTRRGRALAHTEAVLTAAMYLVGCAYNFCKPHASLRRAAPAGAGLKLQERTPAMAAGLTDHAWTMQEVLTHPIPLPPWVAPKRRGRPPKAKQPALARAA
jgi:hypothetical protein